MDVSSSEVQHHFPAWGDRADYLICAEIPGERAADQYRTEQWWAKNVGDGLYEICCIPFFTYGFALGDVVKVDENFTVTELVEKSGRHVRRVYLTDGFSSQHQEETGIKVMDHLESMGAITEHLGPNYIVADFGPRDDVEAAMSYVRRLERLGLLHIEDGVC